MMNNSIGGVVSAADEKSRQGHNCNKEFLRDNLLHVNGAKLRIILLICIFLMTLIPSSLFASDTTLNLKGMSLEDLVNIEVTSVSKKSEKLSEAAAAIFVITADDIKRSGFKSIPEALRLVPGMHVGRISGSQWAITARGFNADYANKLLVLIDGRSVYTPLFSGVYWVDQDIVMEDIERIEIIRGPGATLWGANAVNGVINIITKNASKTTGMLVNTIYETNNKTNSSARYGFKLNDKTHLRIFTKYIDHEGLSATDGTYNNDGWNNFRTGFRFDCAGSEKDNIFIRGDYFKGHFGQRYNRSFLTPPYGGIIDEVVNSFGASIIGRWVRQISSTSELTTQFYYDYTSRKNSLISEKLDIINLDFQYSLEPMENMGVIIGLGYREYKDKIDSASIINLNPLDKTDAVYNAFVQTDIMVIPDRLKLTLGSKFEHNDNTGYEVQPSGRVLWMPHDNHSIWAAISRAVRTPSRSETSIDHIVNVVPPDTLNPMSVPIVFQMLGNKNTTSEYLLAYEAGYKGRLTNNLSLDIAGFYNRYSDLRSLEVADPKLIGMPPSYVLIEMNASNNIMANSYGFEVLCDWIPSSYIAIKATYTNFRLDITSDEGSSGTVGFVISEGFDPRHQFGLRMAIDPVKGVNLDLGLRSVGKLTVYNIDRYLTTDVRVMYQPVMNLELEFGGHNLSGLSHTEFLTELNSSRAMIERTAYSSITWRF